MLVSTTIADFPCLCIFICLPQRVGQVFSLSGHPLFVLLFFYCSFLGTCCIFCTVPPPCSCPLETNTHSRMACSWGTFLCVRAGRKALDRGCRILVLVLGPFYSRRRTSECFESVAADLGFCIWPSDAVSGLGS